MFFSRSFMLSTAGFTCVAFVAGALAWWAPTFLQLGFALHSNGRTVDPDEYVSILPLINKYRPLCLYNL